MTAILYRDAIAMQVPARVAEFNSLLPSLDAEYWGIALPIMRATADLAYDGTGWVQDANGVLWRVAGLDTVKPWAYLVLWKVVTVPKPQALSTVLEGPRVWF